MMDLKSTQLQRLLSTANMSASQESPPTFLEPEGSLHRSQEPAALYTLRLYCW
jgi:hypothetical protein